MFILYEGKDWFFDLPILKRHPSPVADLDCDMLCSKCLQNVACNFGLWVWLLAGNVSPKLSLYFGQHWMPGNAEHGGSEGRL